MAARRIAPDLFQILGVEERPQKFGNVCVEQGIVSQSSNAGYVIAEVLKLLANRIGVDELDRCGTFQTGSGAAKRDQPAAPG